MKIVPIYVLMASMMLASCATPQARVETGLMEAGLSPRMAACMADRMVDRLSLVQLKRLQSLVRVGRTDLERVTVDGFLYKIRALEDPEIFAVTSKAALVCALER